MYIGMYIVYRQSTHENLVLNYYDITTLHESISKADWFWFNKRKDNIIVYKSFCIFFRHVGKRWCTYPPYPPAYTISNQVLCALCCIFYISFQILWVRNNFFFCNKLFSDIEVLIFVTYLTYIIVFLYTGWPSRYAPFVPLPSSKGNRTISFRHYYYIFFLGKYIYLL